MLCNFALQSVVGNADVNGFFPRNNRFTSKNETKQNQLERDGITRRKWRHGCPDTTVAS